MTARTVALARPMLGTTLPFALPIGLSAFLLFSVEPLIGRLVLPVFGGTPAVWATVLFFFQVVLLIGYLYGHVSVTRLGTWGPPLHLLLAGLAVAALIVAPSRVADLRIETVAPVVDLIRSCSRRPRRWSAGGSRRPGRVAPRATATGSTHSATRVPCWRSSPIRSSSSRCCP